MSAVPVISQPVGRPEHDPAGEIILAAAACMSRWGYAKTTAADIARQAGCSRATLYRIFPGGKQSVLEAAMLNELDSLLDAVEAAVAEAEGPAEVLTAMLSSATRFLRHHRGFQLLLEHEPGR